MNPDGQFFLNLILAFGIIVSILANLASLRRKPTIDVDLERLKAEFLPAAAFEQHREARDREIDNLRREIADAMSRAVEQLEKKTEALRLETKTDIKDLLKKLSIEVAGVHLRANEMLEAVAELRGKVNKGASHG